MADPVLPPPPVPPVPEAAPLDEMKQVAKDSILTASDAAEEFRADFKDFLHQVVTPASWKDGLKLVMEGGLGLLKDLEEMISEKKWTPDKMVLRLNASFEQIVQKHPEYQSQWEDVKVSFTFAKMKTDEALAQLKAVAEREYGNFDQSKVVDAVWSGVRAEMKKDIDQISIRLGFKPKTDE